MKSAMDATGIRPREVTLGAAPRMGAGFSRSAMIVAAILAAPAALGANADGPRFEVKPGQELTIPITIADGHAVAGVPRVSKIGVAQPKDGEITVGLEREKGELYDKITATEKTSVPIDFVATGLIGEIKIDERVVCGRLDAPAEMRIGSVSWKIVLRDFEVGKGPASCQ
jgi:hypothetical protein